MNVSTHLNLKGTPEKGKPEVPSHPQEPPTQRPSPEIMPSHAEPAAVPPPPAPEIQPKPDPK